MNNKVKKKREEMDKTQQEMSSDLNITSDYLSMIERGARTPGFNLSKKIADYLNSTIDEIFFKK